MGMDLSADMSSGEQTKQQEKQESRVEAPHPFLFHPGHHVHRVVATEDFLDAHKTNPPCRRPPYPYLSRYTHPAHPAYGYPYGGRAATPSFFNYTADEIKTMKNARERDYF